MDDRRSHDDSASSAWSRAQVYMRVEGDGFVDEGTVGSVTWADEQAQTRLLVLAQQRHDRSTRVLLQPGGPDAPAPEAHSDGAVA